METSGKKLTRQSVGWFDNFVQFQDPVEDSQLYCCLPEPWHHQAHDFCYILQKSQLEIATAVLNPRNNNRYLAQFINMRGDHMELTCQEDVQAGEKTHRACKFCREPSPPGNGPTNAL